MGLGIKTVRDVAEEPYGGIEARCEGDISALDLDAGTYAQCACDILIVGFQEDDLRALATASSSSRAEVITEPIPCVSERLLLSGCMRDASADGPKLVACINLP